MLKILSIGDCNTEGVGELRYNNYPERFSRKVNSYVLNLGHTMSTTREGIRLFDDNYSCDLGLVTVQFGLVDSWRTIAHAPYVLYYPDNKLRYLGRKLAKKYKKIAKRVKLDRLVGENYLVSPEEYRNNLEYIIRNNKCPVVLIETVPNKESFRNPHIEKYNKILRLLAENNDHVFLLSLYDEFSRDIDLWLQADGTHINEVASDYVANKLHKLYDDWIKS